MKRHAREKSGEKAGGTGGGGAGGGMNGKTGWGEWMGLRKRGAEESP